MKFRRISAAAAAFSILACCTSCGGSGGSDSTTVTTAGTNAGTQAVTETVTEAESVTTTAEALTEKPTTAPQEVSTTSAVTEKPSELSALSGLYLSPLETMKISEWYTGDADDSIRKGLEQNNGSLQKGDSRTYNPYSLSFKDGEFSMGKSGGKTSVFYSGKVSEKDGRLWFDYENYNLVASDGSRSDAYNINDPEPEDKNNMYNSVINNLKELNAEGLFYTRIVPRICTFDKLIQYDYMPFLYASAGTNLPPAELYASGGVLYHKTYGTELNGSYTPGSDFSVSYDQIKVQKEDPNSSYNKNKKKTQEEKDELLRNIYFSNIKKAYGIPEDSDDTSSEITFSGGKWEWKSSTGTLLNNGYYAESKNYPGLVVMGIDETSKNNDSQSKEKYMSDANILLIYITDRGEVTYPVLLKYE